MPKVGRPCTHMFESLFVVSSLIKSKYALLTLWRFVAQVHELPVAQKQSEQTLLYSD